MTWVAVGVGAVGAVTQVASARNAADQQASANAAAQNAQRQSAAQMQPWATRGGNAADELQALLGIGSNDTYEDLYNRFLPEFTKTVKKKKKGGLFNKYKEAHVIGNTLLGKGGAKYGTNVDAAGLEARIRSEMAKQKATRERSDFGMLKKDFTNEDFVKDPGYNFRLEEGNRGVQSSLAARGGLFSGQAGKELNRYNQGFASNEFGAAADRYNRNRMNIYSMLSGQAAPGASISQTKAEMGNLAPYALNAGNINAAGAIAQGNALSSGVSAGMNYWQSGKAMQNANALGR